MSVFKADSRHLREVLIFSFLLKKTAAEAHRMLSNTYCEVALSERTCREWFQHFKSVDTDMAVKKRKFRIGGITCHTTKRDPTKLSFSMAMLGHMRRDRSRHTWKR